MSFFIFNFGYNQHTDLNFSLLTLTIVFLVKGKVTSLLKCCYIPPLNPSMLIVCHIKLIVFVVLVPTKAFLKVVLNALK